MVLLAFEQRWDEGESYNAGIQDLTIVRTAKVQVYFRAGAYEGQCVTLERIIGQWRITDEDICPHIIFEH